jgi:hypothetical protein
MQTERTALKEWAVMVDALGSGDIIAMVRKGGIRDRDQHGAGFSLRHSRFVLYPTRFHQSTEQLTESLVARLERSHAAMAPSGHVRIEYVAHTAISVTVTDVARLALVRHELGLSLAALESRFSYRQPGVTLSALRVERLRQPIVVPELRRYGGCVSWLELDDNIPCGVGDVVPVMGEPEFQERLSAITRALRATLTARDATVSSL